MFSIRRIYDDILPTNRSAMEEVRRIFKEQFGGAPAEDIEGLAEKLRNPFKQRFRTILYVAEKGRHQVVGFAIMLHEPELKFGYLDYIAAGQQVTGRGVGAALYSRLREEAAGLGVQGLFFECLPDDADACADPEVRAQNVARLRFYERYGAVPIVGTKYEMAVPGLTSTDNLPHLVHDDLGLDLPLKALYVRRVVRAVLERKYSDLCSPAYVDEVVNSIQDPVARRVPRYVRKAPERVAAARGRELIAMTVNDRHDIHHIRERGYVESPVRIRAILEELTASGLTEVLPVKEFPLEHIRAVHDRDFVDYLERACANTPEGKSIYPYVFPIRNTTRPPRELSVRAGYYCIDTFTPINRNAFPAARRAVDCALTAARRSAQRTADRLRAGPAARPSRRAAGLRRLLLLQQRGDRRPTT